MTSDEKLNEMLRRRIIYHRQAAGLSPAGMARMLGLKPRDYERMEDGTLSVTDPELLGKYIDVMGLNGAAFLHMEVPPDELHTRLANELHTIASHFVYTQQRLNKLLQELRRILYVDEMFEAQLKQEMGSEM
ncbi:hypothetical protein ACTHGU_01390 [Chitinophagaceae bacterium MMS25-I14]